MLSGQSGLPGAHVELDRVSKSFGGVRALEAVSLRIDRGSIHALVGENGAGKSTAGKIVAGALMPDAGRLLVDGTPVQFHSPRDAISRYQASGAYLSGAVDRSGAVGRRERLPRR